MSLPEHQQAEDSGERADASRISLPEILENIARFLPANDIACSVRLVSKALAEAFRFQVIVRLSQPVAEHAFIWRWGCPSCVTSMSIRQRRDLLFLTATSGCLRNLEIAAASAGLVLQATPRQTKGISGLLSTVLEFAAAAGQLEMCKWLRQQGCPWAGALVAAAGAGQAAVCEWLLASGCPWDRAAVYAAARCGHVDLMKALLRRCRASHNQLQPPLPQPPQPQPLQWCAVRASGLLAAAAEGCELATLQRLHDELLLRPVSHIHTDDPPQWEPPPQLFSVDKAAILLAAVSSPTADWRDKVEWLEATLGLSGGGGGGGGVNGRPLTGSSAGAAVCTKAAARPDALERVAWLQARGYPLSGAALDAAASSGNVRLLEYLLEQGIRPSQGTVEAAAKGGHLAFLEALETWGCTTSWHSVLRGAAEGGHTEVVVWRMGRDIDWCVPDPTVLGAARSGSVELMRWLLECRRRWAGWRDIPAHVFRHAVEGGCEEVLRLLVDRGSSMEDQGHPYYVAAVNGDLATLRCLRDLGCPWGPAGEVFGVCVADGACPAPVLRWLLDAGCPVSDWEAPLQAADRRMGGDRAEVRSWLQQEATQRALAEVAIGAPPPV